MSSRERDSLYDMREETLLELYELIYPLEDLAQSDRLLSLIEDALRVKRTGPMAEHVRLNPDIINVSDSDLRELSGYGDPTAAKERERRRQLSAESSKDQEAKR